MISANSQSCINDNTLCIFEIKSDTTFETLLCMSSIGVDPNDLVLFKYIAYLKVCVGPGAYHIINIGFARYGITPFTNFVNTTKLKNRKTCKICYNKKTSFKICYRCSGEGCSKCYYTSTAQHLTCLYCRYTFYDHYTARDKAIERG